MTIIDETAGITLELYHGADYSALLLKDENGIIGRKYYTRRIHKYESKADFTQLKTELETYGYRHGLLPEWDRLQWKENAIDKKQSKC